MTACKRCGVDFDPIYSVYDRLRKIAESKGRSWEPKICVVCLWKATAELTAEPNEAL